MNDRLDELLHQRRLLEDHLAWLNREIAQEQQESGAEAPQSTPDVVPAASDPENKETPQAALLEPETGPEMPPVELRSIQSEVRRGCLIYFTVAILLCAALIAIIVFENQ